MARGARLGRERVVCLRQYTLEGPRWFRRRLHLSGWVLGCLWNQQWKAWQCTLPMGQRQRDWRLPWLKWVQKALPVLVWRWEPAIGQLPGHSDFPRWDRWHGRCWLLAARFSWEFEWSAYYNARGLWSHLRWQLRLSWGAGHQCAYVLLWRQLRSGSLWDPIWEPLSHLMTVKNFRHLYTKSKCSPSCTTSAR